MTNQVHTPQSDRLALELLDQSGLLMELHKREGLFPSPPFNILTLTNKAHREVMHSDILAFLLDTKREHGLGNRFAAALLTKALPSSDWSTCQFETLREHNRVDVLLRDTITKRVIIIENKIYAHEHGDQLRNYWNTIQQKHKGWELQGIFLTPQGSRPSVSDYKVLSYQTVWDVIQRLLSDASKLLPDTELLLRHYADLLRRKIMESDPVTSQLCRDIYRKHRRAIDLITAETNGFQRHSYQLIHNLVFEKQRELQLVIDYDNPEKGIFGFTVQSWLPVLRYRTSDGYTNALFEISVARSGHKIMLHLYIHADAKTIHSAYEKPIALSGLVLERQEFNAKWFFIWSQELLGEDEVATLDDASEMALITTRWQHFVDHQLPEINKHLNAKHLNVKLSGKR